MVAGQVGMDALGSGDHLEADQGPGDGGDADPQRQIGVDPGRWVR